MEILKDNQGLSISHKQERLLFSDFEALEALRPNGGKKTPSPSIKICFSRKDADADERMGDAGCSVGGGSWGIEQSLRGSRQCRLQHHRGELRDPGTQITGWAIPTSISAEELGERATSLKERAMLVTASVEGAGESIDANKRASVQELGIR